MTKNDIKQLAKDCIFSAISAAGDKVYDNHDEYHLSDQELDYFSEQLNKYIALVITAIKTAEVREG